VQARSYIVCWLNGTGRNRSCLDAPDPACLLACSVALFIVAGQIGRLRGTYLSLREAAAAAGTKVKGPRRATGAIVFRPPIWPLVSV
jgi:hypothetical protein